MVPKESSYLLAGPDQAPIRITMPDKQYVRRGIYIYTCYTYVAVVAFIIRTYSMHIVCTRVTHVRANVMPILIGVQYDSRAVYFRRGRGQLERALLYSINSVIESRENNKPLSHNAREIKRDGVIKRFTRSLLYLISSCINIYICIVEHYK